MKKHSVLQTMVATTIFATLLAACSRQSTDAFYLATVDSEPITIEDYRKQLREYTLSLSGKKLDAKLREKVLNALIERTLLQQEAQKRGLFVSDIELENEMKRVMENYSGTSFEKMLASKRLSFDQWKNDLRQTMLVRKAGERVSGDIQPPTEEMIATYYDEHKETFKQSEQVRALHILVDSEEDAFAIVSKISKGAPFETLARERSKGIEAQKGGDLGYFSRGVMPEIFDNTIFPLKVGKVSRVVRSEYGYHIFKLIDRRNAKQRSLAEATPEIRAKLSQEPREQAYKQWLERSLKQKPIKTNKELLAKVF